MRGEAGIVGANLAITLAFALFAVIQLNVSKNRSFDVVNRLEKRLERLDGSTKALPERLALYRRSTLPALSWRSGRPLFRRRL